MGQQLAKLFIDVETLPDNGFGFIQLLFLAGAYSYVLTIGGTMIKDGSELLLLVPAFAGMVGSIVLPVLGAVPDGAIVLFSGLGNDAQKQLNVGIGALAGSTIMLLTVPWALSLYAGRVDFDPDGNGNYKKPRGAGKDWAKTTKGFLGTGVNVNDAIRHAAFSMILTMLSMFVIQIPACFARCSLTDQEADCKTPKWAALSAGIMCIVFFVWYLVDQYKRASVDVVVEAKTLKAREFALATKIMSARVMFLDDVGGEMAGSERAGLLASPHTSAKFEGFVRRIFAKYDRDRTGSIDKLELVALLGDLGEKTDSESVDRFMKEVDTNQDGGIDFKEFFAAMQSAAKKQSEEHAEGVDAQSGHRMGRPSSGFGTQVVVTSSAGVAAGGGNSKKNSKVVDDDDEDDGDVAPHKKNTNNAGAATAGRHRRSSDADGGDGDGEGEDEDEEEDAEMPEDLADLPPEVQRRRVLTRSFWQMGLGTLIVLLFSDPMVDVLNELGTRTHIRPFYVAFVLAPLVSNGSELIAAFAYASKKTVASATISFSTLLGAASMNNTFCLAIFLFIVALKDLKWVFTAEVASMIFVELLMFGMIVLCGLKYRAAWAFFVISLLPLSLALVAGMEAGGLD